MMFDEGDVDDGDSNFYRSKDRGEDHDHGDAIDEMIEDGREMVGRWSILIHSGP